MNEQADRLVLRRAVPIVPFVLLLGVVLAIFTFVCIRTLLSVREGQWEIARGTAENITAAIQGDVERNIEVYDLSLRNVVNLINSPDVIGLNRKQAHLVYFDHAATAKHFGPIRVFDRLGNLLFDSADLTPKPINVASEEFFSVHRSATSAGLFISRPRPDIRGLYAIMLSRRIVAPDGSFGGVVVGSIDITYFHDLFRRLDMSQDDALTLINQDGFIIMRRPFDIEMFGMNPGGQRGIERFSSATSGWFEGVGAVDSIPRLYVWKRGSYFTVISGRSLAEIYRPWRAEAEKIGGLLGTLLLTVIVVAAFLVREARIRKSLQASLAELATTDGLTRLTNRRSFDLALDGEWKRASRDTSEISVLLLDVDHFKRFNDQHGHQAGDAVLRRVAEVMATTARRPGDCAARYGGEEFVLLLPQTDHETAVRIAEAIRIGVEGLPEAAVTVSIGVATLIPCMGGQTSYFLAQADEALYRAKRTGRNQVCSALPILAHGPSVFAGPEPDNDVTTPSRANAV